MSHVKRLLFFAALLATALLCSATDASRQKELHSKIRHHEEQPHRLSTNNADSQPELVELTSTSRSTSKTGSKSKTGQLPGALATVPYSPTSEVYDNPGTSDEPTDLLPSTPHCTIQPNTVEEIRKMRLDASEMGKAVAQEIQVMAQRKTYIEQMTNYINDRIRELNKVKNDLKQEEKWVQITSNRIRELAEREKLVKVQSIINCVNTQIKTQSGETASKTSNLKNLQSQMAYYLKNIKQYRTDIELLNQGKTPGAEAAK